MLPSLSLPPVDCCLGTRPIHTQPGSDPTRTPSSQTFLPQGPSPIFGPAQTIQSGDAPPNGTSVGAVQAIVTDPADANKMYIGTVNGGVWETLNGGTTWTQLSDNQRSLSIASLAVDPTNPNVLIAGTGVTSSTSLGGPKIGLLYSNTGGRLVERAGPRPPSHQHRRRSGPRQYHPCRPHRSRLPRTPPAVSFAASTAVPSRP